MVDAENGVFGAAGGIDAARAPGVVDPELELESEVAALSLDRCIGCGVCAAKCPSEAILLMKKEKETIPPEDLDALNKAIMKNRAGVHPA